MCNALRSGNTRFRSHVCPRLPSGKRARSEASTQPRFNIRDSLSDLLKKASAEKEGYPNSLESLLNKGGVKLVLPDKNDPDGAGFVQCAA